MENNSTKPAGSAFVLMPVILVLWGSFAAVSKLTLASMDSFQLQFWMFGIAAVLMTAWLLVRGRLRRAFRVKPKELLLILLCGLPSYLYYFFYTLSLRLVPAVEASMLNYLFPVMVVLFAIPINGEKLTAAKALSVAIGFVGTVVILTGGRLANITLTNIKGDLLAIGAAVFWGIFSNLGKWNKHDMEVSMYFYVLLSFALSFISLLCFSKFSLPGIVPLAGALWVSLSNIVLSMPLCLKVMRIAPSAFAASFAFITPFVSLLFIMVLTGEPLKLSQGIGLLIIVGAIAVQQIRFSGAGKKQSPTEQ